MESRKCIVCGNALYKGIRFCSKECEALYRKKVEKEECLNCGREFEIKGYEKGKRKFCSHQCYWEYKKKQVKCVCFYCGKEFMVYKARVLKGAKFCSKKCEMLYRWGDSRKVEVECLWCGKKFQVFQSEMRNDWAKFCSKDCFLSYKKKERVKGTCFNCGKEIEVFKDVLDKRKRMFCSRQCYLDYLKKSCRVERVCLNCGKNFEVMLSTFKKGRGVFCSKECSLKYWGSEEGKNRLSESAKRLWQNSEYRNKVVKAVAEALQIKPNGLERAFCELLQSYFTNEWGYVGDGKVFIAGYVPDFIHKDEKWIIEVNGDYWHSFPEVKEKDRRKRETYEKYGYRVLEVWESEFRSDPIGVVDKIVVNFYREN